MPKIIEKQTAKKSLEDLPERIVNKYKTQKERLEQDPRDPRLHTKKLKGLDGVYSFRVTRSYRALFYFHTKKVVVIFSVGHRKEVCDRQ